METGAIRQFGRHIEQTAPDYSFCAGCGSCEIVCALTHDGAVGPSHRRLFVRRDIRTMIHTVYGCRQCSDHPCYDGCPKKGEAMRIDERGIVYIDESACVGCGACARACAFDPPRINFIKELPRAQRRARKCDLCRGREDGPACVQWCPVRCIELVGGDEI
jgi:Fe-S-cluster-containing hydrogenase component 2